MAFARARALRSLQSTLRHSGSRVVPRASAPARTQLVQKRYQSGGESHGEHQSSSDIPWMIGAVAVTIPSCWFLWPETSHAEHSDPIGVYMEFAEHEEKQQKGEETAPAQQSEEGSQEEGSGEESKDEDSGESKDETSEESKEEGSGESKAESSGESGEDSGEQGSGEGSEEGKTPTKASGNESKSLPPGGDDNQKPNEPNAPEQGRAGSEGDKSEDPDTGKSEEKGKKQKHIESNLAKSIHPDNSKTDPTARSKADQFGISTGPTKHSTDLDDKLKKYDGTPATAKAKGTVELPK